MARRTRRSLTRAVVSLGIAGSMVAAAGCSPASDAGPDETSTLRIGSSQEAISFDWSGQDRLSLSMVYDYLFYQENGVYTPRAAESYEYTEGNTVLKITLRDDLKFSDGTPIDAALLKELILYGKDNGAYFSVIDEITVIDDRTVEVHQTKADNKVMLSMWAMPLFPMQALEDPESISSTPLESGPYLLDEDATTDGAVYTYERNEDYWDAANFPYDDVTITLLPDPTSRLNALKSGQVDIAPVAGTTAPEAEAAGFVTHELQAQFSGLIMGDRRGEIVPAMGDVRVRQAIAMAFDRDAIVQSIFGGYAQSANQPYREGMAGYQEDEADLYSYDPEKAKELLAEAGYAEGFDLTIPTYPPATKEIEPYLKQALGEIGIRVTYAPQSDDTWLPAFSGGEYAVVPMLLPYEQTPDYADPDYFWNPWKNSDPKAEELYATINGGTPEEAAEAGAELGRLQLDEVWLAVYSSPSSIWASKENIDLAAPQYADWVLSSDFSPTE